MDLLLFLERREGIPRGRKLIIFFGR